MAVKPIPDGFHSVTPYLVADDVDALLRFTQEAFGASVVHKMTRPDGSTGHVQVRVGDSPVMMGPACGEWGAMPATLYLYVDDADATYRQALDAGATTVIEPVNQFYGDRSAGVKDPCGNLWWIATHVEDVAPDELERRAAAMFRQRAEAATAS